MARTFELTGDAAGEASMTMSLDADSRFSLVGQFFRASAIFVRRARALEASDCFSNELETEYVGLVTAVVMQCSSALEAESHEITTYGPGSYLGSNGIDFRARELLIPCARGIDRLPTISRFDKILETIGRPMLNSQSDTYKGARLLIQLRNELVHYKSGWVSEIESKELYRALQSLGHAPSPFASSATPYFPGQCLSADCAAWALRRSVDFLEDVYSALGVPSRFRDYGSSLIP